MEAAGILAFGVSLEEETIKDVDLAHNPSPRLDFSQQKMTRLVSPVPAPGCGNTPVEEHAEFVSQTPEKTR